MSISIHLYSATHTSVYTKTIYYYSTIGVYVHSDLNTPNLTTVTIRMTYIYIVYIQIRKENNIDITYTNINNDSIV